MLKASDEKLLFKVSLSVDELDKFSNSKKHPSLKVLTCFYQDEEYDDVLYDVACKRAAPPQK